MSVYNNLALDQAANDTAAEFRPREDRRDRQGPRDRKAAAAEQPSDRHQAHLHRHRLLRDLQPAERDAGRHHARTRSRRSRRTRVRTGGKDYEVDALVLATGFDAMTGSVAKIDIRGRDGRTLNQKWAEGPQHLSRPDERRLPQPLHHHRSRQPLGAVEHDRLDRAACRLDRRLPRLHARAAASTRSRPTQDAEDKWVAHVNEVADTTLYPQANSWYMGANIPGKPRIFMPYIGGVGALPADLQRRRRQGL